MINKLFVFLIFFCAAVSPSQLYSEEYNADDYNEIISYFVNPHLSNNKFSGWAKGILAGDTRSIEYMLNHLDTVNSRTLWEIRSLLVQIGKPAVKFLTDYISDTLTTGNLIIVEVLGDIGDTSAVEKISGLLDSKHVQLRNVAAMALGKIKFTDSNIINKLKHLTYDTNNMVKKSAIVSLGKLSDTNSEQDTGLLDLLFSHLSDSYFYLRFSAVESVQKMDSEIVIPFIFEKINNADKYELRYLLRILSSFNISGSYITEIENIFYSNDDELVCAYAFKILRQSVLLELKIEKYKNFFLKKFNRNPIIE
ncbi:HEAT repeat domain-containing protein [Candidatus Dependentiae bacterium]|nr:HEAT repeat domain-containing protein [Candidatus Dependentiae bacterium]